MGQGENLNGGAGNAKSKKASVGSSGASLAVRVSCPPAPTSHSHQMRLPWEVWPQGRLCAAEGHPGGTETRSCLVITLPVDPSGKGVWVVQIHVYHVGCAQGRPHRAKTWRSSRKQVRQTHGGSLTEGTEAQAPECGCH